MSEWDSFYLSDPVEDGRVSHESIGALASGDDNDVGAGDFIESGGGLNGEHATISAVQALAMAHKHNFDVG